MSRADAYKATKKIKVSFEVQMSAIDHGKQMAVSQNACALTMNPELVVLYKYKRSAFACAEEENDTFLKLCYTQLAKLTEGNKLSISAIKAMTVIFQKISSQFTCLARIKSPQQFERYKRLYTTSDVGDDFEAYAESRGQLAGTLPVEIYSYRNFRAIETKEYEDNDLFFKTMHKNALQRAVHEGWN